jgi:hypothetical protein
VNFYCSAGFEGKKAAAEFRRTGIVALDDPSGESIESMVDELFDWLGNWADEIETVKEEIETPIGTVYLMRDAGRVSAEAAVEQLRKSRLL